QPTHAAAARDRRAAAGWLRGMTATKIAVKHEPRAAAPAAHRARAPQLLPQQARPPTVERPGLAGPPSARPGC
ncbi:MAG: hypothetical protein ACLP8S_10180, partial [Solirubrobacteraceae bacterium]